jgi:hypothetical protein
MKSTQLAIALLVAGTQATVWPEYTTDAGVHDAVAAGTYLLYARKPYACLRKGYVWVPNQTVT